MERDAAVPSAGFRPVQLERVVSDQHWTASDIEVSQPQGPRRWLVHQPGLGVDPQLRDPGSWLLRDEDGVLVSFVESGPEPARRDLERWQAAAFRTLVRGGVCDAGAAGGAPAMFAPVPPVLSEFAGEAVVVFNLSVEGAEHLQELASAAQAQVGTVVDDLLSSRRLGDLGAQLALLDTSIELCCACRALLAMYLAPWPGIDAVCLAAALCVTSVVTEEELEHRLGAILAEHGIGDEEWPWVATKAEGCTYWSVADEPDALVERLEGARASCEQELRRYEGVALAAAERRGRREAVDNPLALPELTRQLLQRTLPPDIVPAFSPGALRCERVGSERVRYLVRLWRRYRSA